MTDTEEERTLLVLYGSQTGYAEDTARRIGRQAWRRHYAVKVQAMDQTDRTALFTSRGPVVFVCSTTGQGDAPDNMRHLWRVLLRKALPRDALDRLRYAVFGLGDSSYAKFNYAAKRLDRRLAQLGAKQIVPRGDGDDQHYLGADGALDPWLDSLWPALLLLNDQSSSLHRAIIPDSVPPPPSASVELGTGTMELQGPPEPDTAVAATLVLTERITTPDHFQDVRHLQFRTDKDVVSWNPGDCAVLRPSNTAQDVDAFLAAAHWTEQADSVVRLESSDLPQWVPRQTTLRWLSTYYFDIAGVPRRSFFELLGYFSPNTTERERLQELGSTEGQDDLHAYCMRPRRTVTETLADFPATPVPLAHMLDVVPMIAERSFSISSSSQVDLTVAVVEYRTMMQLPRRGVCSRWLASLAPGASVHLRVARGLMHLPRDAGTPVLMVGPGTGIAAFMAFIEARPAANYLFFGCRSKIKDFYYRAQLEQWCTEGRLRLFCAFSRDSGEYVQHRIREQGELVWSLLDRQGASVYVSGNANRMPQDVRAAFVDVVKTHGALSPEDADAYVGALEKANRYQEECWY